MIEVGKKSIIGALVEIIADRFYFYCNEQAPKSNTEAYYFNIDDIFKYSPINEDFGPLSIANIYQYVCSVKSLIEDPSNAKIVYYHHTCPKYRKYTNSILLVCSFLILTTHRSVESAWQPFEQYSIPPYRDASKGKYLYDCLIIDCLRGLKHAINLGWFSLKTFQVKQYLYYDSIQHGDVNEILHGKMYAFSTPALTDEIDKFGNRLLDVNSCAKVLQSFGIKVAINLSMGPNIEKQFKKHGISCYSLPFNKKKPPPIYVAQKFLSIVESYDDDVKIAVHCRGGIGKTCTMIGCFAIKHYQFKAKQFIGWARLCRKGAVMGPQQSFLEEFEHLLKESNLGEQSEIGKKAQKQIAKSKRQQMFSILTEFILEGPLSKQDNRQRNKSAISPQHQDKKIETRRSMAYSAKKSSSFSKSMLNQSSVSNYTQNGRRLVGIHRLKSFYNQ